MTQSCGIGTGCQMIGGVAQQPDGVAHLVMFGREVAPPFAPGSQVLETRVFVLC